MNVPTPPEDASSLIALWFDRVMRKLVTLETPADENTVDSLIADLRPESWEAERWDTCQKGGNDLMDGALACWMDAGIYARSILAELRDPDDAMPAAKRACTPEAWALLLYRFAETALNDLAPSS